MKALTRSIRLTVALLPALVISLAIVASATLLAEGSQATVELRVLRSVSVGLLLATITDAILLTGLLGWRVVLQESVESDRAVHTSDRQE